MVSPPSIGGLQSTEEARLLTWEARVDILRFCHRSEVTDMGVGGWPGGPLGRDVEGLRGRERVVGGLREGVRRHATTVHSNSSFPLTIVGGNSFRSMSTSSRSLNNNPHYEVWEREACQEKPCFWLCRVTTVKSGVSRTWQSRDSDSTVVPLPTATSRPQPAPSIHSRDLTHGDRARGDQEWYELVDEDVDEEKKVDSNGLDVLAIPPGLAHRVAAIKL